MPTYHFSKKKFIEELERLIKDDDHILLSNEFDGTIEALSKKKLKRVPFVFASDAFERQDTIGDLLKSNMFSFVIAKDEIVAEKFKTHADTKKG